MEGRGNQTRPSADGGGAILKQGSSVQVPQRQPVCGRPVPSAPRLALAAMTLRSSSPCLQLSLCDCSRCLSLRRKAQTKTEKRNVRCSAPRGKRRKSWRIGPKRRVRSGQYEGIAKPTLIPERLRPEGEAEAPPSALETSFLLWPESAGQTASTAGTFAATETAALGAWHHPSMPPMTCYGGTRIAQWPRWNRYLGTPG